MSRRLMRTLVVGSAATALAVGVGAAMMAPASAHDYQRPPVASPPLWQPSPDDICAALGFASQWAGSSGFFGDWEDDDDWQFIMPVDFCSSTSAQADLDAALEAAQGIYQETVAKAKAAYNTGIADEVAAYREDRASTRSQVERLLFWRGFVSATRDEQRILNRATDAATRDLALDEDAAYEIFDLETTDETVAAGRTDFRAARTAAERARTLAVRAAGSVYEEAVDMAVRRLADSQEETGSTIGRARAWKTYRQSLAAARSARSATVQEARAAYDSAVAEASYLLAPGDESYVWDNGIQPIMFPMPHHRGHGHDWDD